MVLDWILGKWSCKWYYWENLETLTIDYILDKIVFMLFLKYSHYITVMWESDFGFMKYLLNACEWSVISTSNFQMFPKMYMHMFIRIRAHKYICLNVYVHVSMCVCLQRCPNALAVSSLWLFSETHIHPWEWPQPYSSSFFLS